MSAMACSVSPGPVRLGLVRTAWMSFMASVSSSRGARVVRGPVGGVVVLLMGLSSFWNGTAPAARGWPGPRGRSGEVLESGGQPEGLKSGVLHVPGVVGVVLDLGG
jgi:hypothetical protein